MSAPLRRVSVTTLLVLSLATAAAAAQASILDDLFGTGLSSTGTPLAGGAIDPHYTLISSPDAAFGGPEAFVINNGFPIGPWFANSSTSKWIGARADAGQGNVPGLYTYRTSFDLSGFDPASASITGQWASDNNGVDILINGASTGQTTTFTNFLTGFTPFAISSGFIAGINTIDFVVRNGADTLNPTGLRVELQGTALPVPEPGTWLMALAGLGVMALVRMRRH